jgi:carbon monoxide dehydrogenase subunit G
MQMNDSQRTPASREKVWAALNDPSRLIDSTAKKLAGQFFELIGGVVAA